jgi:guanylate kinase
MQDRQIHRRGLMLVLSSPSGAGKTTISRRLLERDAALTLSISATTRRARPAESDGEDYHFISAPDFAAMVEEDAFLEHAQVFGHAYGTPRQAVEESLSAGRDVLFDIDWQGTQQLSERAPQDIVSIFILPPSTAELERRLYARAQDSEKVVHQRMAKAADEMSHWAEYHYIIINDEMERSLAEVEAILAAERLRRERRTGLSDFVERLRAGC